MANYDYLCYLLINAVTNVINVTVESVNLQCTTKP